MSFRSGHASLPAVEREYLPGYHQADVLLLEQIPAGEVG
jgi:hypothetical protein